LDWLSETSGSLSDFERLLSAEIRQETALEYGQLDEALSFHQMTDAEMVESSLQVLAQHNRTCKGISHERVRNWLDSLGSSQPHSCPSVSASPQHSAHNQVQEN